MESMIEAIVRYEEEHEFLGSLHLLVANIATNSLFPRAVPDIAQLGALDAGKTGLPIEPLAGTFPVTLAEAASLEAHQITGHHIRSFPATAAKAPTLGLDKLDPLIKGLIQSVTLVIKAKVDGKTEFLKLPDSQFLAQTAGTGFGLLFGGHCFHDVPCGEGVECLGAAI